MRKLRVALFVSFSGRSLLEKLLLRDDIEIVGVATDDPAQKFVSPNKRVWQHMSSKKQASQLAKIEKICRENNIPLHTDRIKNKKGETGDESAFLKIFRDQWRPDVTLMRVFGQVIPSELISVPRYGFYNIHSSSIKNLNDWPIYAGGKPFEDLLKAGEKSCTLVLHKVTPGIDDGDAQWFSPPIPLISTKKNLSDKKMAAFVIGMHKRTAPYAAWLGEFFIDRQIMPKFSYDILKEAQKEKNLTTKLLSESFER